MLTKTQRVACVAAACLLTRTSLAAEDGLQQPSAFHSVGYSWQQEAAADTIAPVMDAETASIVDPIPAETNESMVVGSGAVPVYDQPAPAPSSCVTCQPSCCCPKCDDEKKAALKKAAAGSHKGLFYANDFSYLSDPCWDGHLLGDCMKGLGDGPLSLDFGGQYRARLHREENHRGLGLTGRSDDFLLHRTRLYMNAKLGSDIRFYGEVLDANSNYEAFNPRPIEENRWDVQNLFIDATLLSDGSRKLVARGGRQEMALGNQRYFSPLDWANTRRTFDGGRLMYTSDDWTVDGFWLAPMVRDFNSFDEANEDQAFYGVYSTYKALANGTLDLYWLAFDNDTAGFAYDSLGARYNGTLGEFLFESEGAYQFGSNADGSDHDAGFYMIGLGKAFTDHSCKPTAWIYFDWASGGDELGAGQGHHHFQPLAHKYLGLIDFYARSNLIDLNFLTTLQISKKVKLLLWYHNFWLENQNDTPYNVNMSAFAPGVTPGDDELGQEIDAVLTIGINERSNIIFGYSHFWSGDYYNTPGLPVNDVDANFFYTQYTLNF